MSGSKFVKVRFVGKGGATAGLVFSEAHAKQSVVDLSRHFPASEALKMDRVEKSPPYDKWDDALKHAF